MSAANIELARRGFEAALGGDLGAVGELLDSEVKWHGGDLSAPGACHNREQALEFMRQTRSRGRVGELLDVVDAGDKVVVIMRAPSHEGEQAAPSANLATFRDGKIIEIVQYPNPEDALVASGV